MYHNNRHNYTAYTHIPHIRRLLLCHTCCDRAVVVDDLHTFSEHPSPISEQRHVGAGVGAGAGAGTGVGAGAEERLDQGV
jgi:hypothetical protein